MQKIFRDCLFGGAWGDAAGAPHELKVKSGPYTGKLQYTTTVGGRFHEPKILPVGSVTDDTQMTMYLLKYLIQTKAKLTREGLVHTYIDFANTYPTCLGKNTRFLFRSIKTTKGFEARRAKVDPNNQAIGPLMRCSALALLPKSLSDQEIADYCYLDCDVTNSHPNCVSAVTLHVLVLRKIFEGLSSGRKPDELKPELLEFCQEFAETNEEVSPEHSTAVYEGLGGINRDVSGKDPASGSAPLDRSELASGSASTGRGGNKGWICHGTYCAVWALAHFSEYKSAIDAVILKGGDCDTTAKIAGDWMGALYGVNVPDSEIELLVTTNPVLHDLGGVVDAAVALYSS